MRIRRPFGWLTIHSNARHTTGAILLWCLTAANSAVAADDAPQDQRTKSAPVNVLPEVVVNGRSDAQVDDSLSAGFVVPRTQLTKFGDASLADVLGRLPGISVTRNGRRDVEVRMRGLGAGYSQILLDGQPLPAGFSVDSISPELVEKIEVYRLTSAERGSQGIAGTINIVLRKKSAQALREVKGSVYGGYKPSASLAFTSTDKGEGSAYSLSTSARREEVLRRSRIDYETTEAGASLGRSSSLQEQREEIQELNVATRASRSLSNGGKLSLDGFLLLSRQIRHLSESPIGEVASSISDSGSASSQIDRQLARGTLTFERPVEGGHFDSKLIGTWAKRQSDVSITSLADDGSVASARHTTYPSVDTSVVGQMRHVLEPGKRHQVSFGLETGFSRRREQFDDDILLGPSVRDRYLVTVQRNSIFAQDEIAITKSVSGYAGARAEDVVIRPVLNDASAAKTHARIFSPIAQLRFKRPSDAEVVGVALSRTQKVPQIADLTPRRYFSVLNSRTSPDSEGNPFLRPESAWIVDVSYEKQVSAETQFGFTASRRRISDFVVQELSFSEGRWVVTPNNRGVAWVSSIDVNGKTSWKGASSQDGELDLGVGVSWNVSTVESAPPPYNRIDQQVPVSTTLSTEYRWPGGLAKAGGAFSFQSAGRYQVSEEQLNARSSRSSLDLYVVRQLRPGLMLRTTVTNALNSRTSTSTEFRTGGDLERQTDGTRAGRIFRLALEMKL